MAGDSHSIHSVQRESLVEHLFVGEILRYLWTRGIHDVEVLKPQVDDAGYDVVMACNGTTRHIQLKSVASAARTARFNVHTRLAAKPCGCVLIVVVDDATMKLGPYLWFGGPPGESMQGTAGFRTAKHTKGDASDRKLPRPNLRIIPRSRFEVLDSIEEVIEKLFGQRHG